MTKSLPPKSIVLYADDDADDLELLKDIFDEYSTVIELITFRDGLQLLDYIEDLAPLQPKPCLIILDINMPGLSGKQTLKKLRDIEGFTELPVVLFSTSTLPTEVAFATAYGAGFITKPLHPKQFHQIANLLIEHCTIEVKAKIRKSKGNNNS